MIFLVNDANILIDLLKIDLLDTFFQLEFDFQVTDIVFAEIQEDNAADLQSFLESKLLTKCEFSFEDLLQIQNFEVENPALSIADCSCLFLSRKLSATLLTGDGALRRIAKQNDIPVHGILWVFDEMVSSSLISKNEAREKLSHLMNLNLRLPVKECRKRLHRWKKQDREE
jgi:predicted nucleic acid-binding protein